ncbi:adenine phosphoribosyltransferase [Polyrhizophydium stewartii]|uniref:adenine phosphoribosyltransferase n=1 Tax=Polyrhizophydium stewartii TaxID=2732419 RepID=A0ABR4NHM2_9FUNG|nr:adenine phosphoribosyltransferase [Polyrhizophydium stewartii]
MTLTLAEIKNKIRPTADFPKKGILFQDIFPIFEDPKATESLVEHIINHLKETGTKVDVVVGLDSRGFLLGPWLANKLSAAFVPVRKAGKLPPPCHKVGYTKEYGTDYFEISQTAIKPGQNVLVFDDLIATGGSAKAAGELIQLCGGKTVKYVFFVELTFLKGKDALDAPTFSLFQYDD